ncbi:MAG: Ku protein [Phycisphaerae bacterium]|nr:Ku protein [Phycisphaerae bacterium]
MARSIWSGSISFGLVNVPVRLLPAVREQNVQFHLMTPDGSCRLRQKLYCPETGQEYEYREAARGVEISPGRYVMFEGDELASLRPQGGRVMNVEQFVAIEQIDPVYYDRSYYLLPDEGGEKAYALLTAAMEQSGRAAVVRFVMRNRENLAVVRSRNGTVVLHTLYYHDEVLEPDALDPGPEDSKPVRKKLASKAGSSRELKAPSRELKVAEQLIKALDQDFDPTAFEDTFRHDVQELIERKSEGEEIVTPATASDDVPPVYNLMDALKRSLKEAESETRRGRREEKAPPVTASRGEPRKPARKTAARESSRAPDRRRRTA